jgi:hypothetical protein
MILAPGQYTQNAFYITYEYAKYARWFELGRTFQHNVMFAGKARSLP